MRRVIIGLLLCVAGISHADAAQWTQLQDNKHARLMLDKQSIAASGKYQKAWVKIDYKTMQTNLEYPEKHYNKAKLLWYFKCDEQQSATAQVYQFLNEEQVFSAALNVKRARFLEPVPETEADIVMHYVCEQKADKEAKEARKLRAEEAAKNKPVSPPEPKGKPAKKIIKPTPVVAAPPPVASEAKTEVPSKDASDSKEKHADKKAKATDGKADHAPSDESHSEKKLSAKEKRKQRYAQLKAERKAKRAKAKAQKDKAHAVEDEHEAEEPAKQKPAKKKRSTVNWKYTGKSGPEFWGDLNPDYASCKAGRNQSPINIDKTITTTQKPLKTFQRFPAVEIIHNGHTIQANFKSGNIMVVDGVMYQMKQVDFHAPSEHQVMGKTFPLEAQFLHADPKGNLAVLAVMYEEGPENKAIAKLWQQMPKRKGKPKKLKNKVLAGDLIARKKDYYRFSGSLTAPPCSEGVVWIVTKTPMTASKQQINAFKKVMKDGNSRPVQPRNGRMVIE